METFVVIGKAVTAAVFVGIWGTSLVIAMAAIIQSNRNHWLRAISAATTTIVHLFVPFVVLKRGDIPIAVVSTAVVWPFAFLVFLAVINITDSIAQEKKI